MDVNLEKEVFTTFEVAKICSANITSIKNWIEQGEINAFRTPGGHYRIERKELNAFLNRLGMPNPLQEADSRRILAILDDSELAEQVKRHFGEQYDYQVTSDPIDGLIKLGHWGPRVVVVDSRLDAVDAIGLIARVRSAKELGEIEVVVIHDGEEAFEDRLRKAGARHLARSSDGPKAILEALSQVLA